MQLRWVRRKGCSLPCGSWASWRRDAFHRRRGLLEGLRILGRRSRERLAIGYGRCVGFIVRVFLNIRGGWLVEQMRRLQWKKSRARYWSLWDRTKCSRRSLVELGREVYHQGWATESYILNSVDLLLQPAQVIGQIIINSNLPYPNNYYLSRCCFDSDQRYYQQVKISFQPKRGDVHSNCCSFR